LIIVKSTPRLKTQIWVQGFIRRLIANDFLSFVLKSGDKDAGAVFIKVNRFENGCLVYSQVTDSVGGFHWLPSLGGKWELEDKVDQYIQRQLKYDKDLWVIEVEDPRANFEIDGSILEL
jgi:hypothetical protein